MAFKSEDELLAAIAEDMAGVVPRVIAWTMDNMRFESPIERVMFAALYARFRYGTPVPMAAYSQDFKGIIPPEQVSLFTQATVGDYRVDILVAANFHSSGKAIMVVECDGHDFHERTKEQAARDRKRDRTLQSEGYLVFRFTGSEIWRDPGKCAQEAAQALLAALDRNGDDEP